jgi:hypothetical protein
MTGVYTLQIGAYTFQVQPELERSFDYEYNEELTPPVPVAELETWHLRNATFVGSESDVTTDFESLRELLGSRSAQITSAVFARDSVAVWTLSGNGGMLVRGFASKPAPGLWATFWQGDITILARHLLADGSGIVKLAKRLSYTYDSAGLAIVKLSGSLSTVPGTSAQAAARNLALASPGANYGLLTAGPNGQPNVEVLDPDTDTRATWESTWKQSGITLPAGTNEFIRTIETVDDLL